MIWDGENEREIVLLTNHLECGSTTISRIYKDRWQSEMPLPLFANILDSIGGGHEIESGHSGV